MAGKKKPPRYTDAEIAQFKEAKKPTPLVAMSNGIGISQGTDLTSGADNEIVWQDGFDGRAILLPPNTVDGTDPDVWVFAAYITWSTSPASLPIPSGIEVANILYADLPSGIVPDLFAQLTAAIHEYGEPVDSGGTGNNSPNHP